MSSGADDLVSRLLKQSIITLCRETVTFRNRLEIDGIVCLAVDGVEQHVVKIHELFTARPTLSTGISDSPRLPTPEITRVPSPVLSNGSTNDDSNHVDLSSSSEHLDLSVSPQGKGSSQLFDHLPFRSTPNARQDGSSQQSSSDSQSSQKSLFQSPYVTLDKQRFPGIEKLTISDAKDIPCKKCGKTIENVVQYESHNMVAHGHFTCMICLSTFTSRNNMKRHIRLHTGVKPYVCHKCPESFSRNDDFKRHLLRHTFQKPLRCAICQSGFSDRGSVRTHMMKMHACSIFHACPTCGECYTDPKQLVEHKKAHNETLDYRCSLCSFSGLNALMYNKHMLTHGPMKTYTCQHCDKSYTDPIVYSNHMKKHKSDENVKAYTCCFCELVLTTYDQFQRHEHSHVHSKQHTCSICQKHFRYPSNLREHMLTHIPKHELMNAARLNISDSTGSQNDNCEIEYQLPQTTSPTQQLPQTPVEQIQTENEMEETADAPDDLEENNNDVPKEEDYGVGTFEYWCTECQHGFSTEKDLQDHILQHEQDEANITVPDSPDYIEQETSKSPAAESNDMNEATVTDKSRQTSPINLRSEGTKVNKRKSASVNRNFLGPKKTKTYEEMVDNAADDQPSDEMYQNIPKPALDEMINEMKEQTIMMTYYNVYGTPNNTSPETKETVASANGIGTAREPSVVLVMPVNLADIPVTVKQESESNTLGISASLRKQIEAKRDGSVHLLNDMLSSKVRTSVSPVNTSTKEDDVTTVNGTSDSGDDVDLGHYSKSSVLGMDTEFSSTPQRTSTTTINLKVRNPGFEKVVTPDILFETKAPFTCGICSETFDDFATFDQHGIKIHRRFICSYCGKAFTSRPNRERHVRYHTGEKPYKCDLCPVSFFRGDDLKYHRTTKHADVKPFTCAACKTSFSYPKELEKHLRFHPDHRL